MEGGLWFGNRLLDTGQLVGVDFEDWFSADLTPSQRKARPVAKLRQLERHLLRHCAYTFTTSHVMARAMAGELDSPEPTVIYNTFPLDHERRHVAESSGGHVKLHWFSLVIGPERGLEELFTALPQVQGGWELHLRGSVTAAYRSALFKLLPKAMHSQIYFHTQVDLADLPTVLRDYDIGLALELGTIPSRDLTITNKFFHYLQAGLAIVASDTKGHREGLRQAPGAGIVFAPGKVNTLVDALNSFLSDPSRLRLARHASRQAFVDQLAHDYQADRYAERATLALGAPDIRA